MRNETSDLRSLHGEPEPTPAAPPRAARAFADRLGRWAGTPGHLSGRAFLGEQFRRALELMPVVGRTAAASSLVLGGVLLTTALTSLEVPDLTQDPLAVIERRTYAPYVGILSNLGVLLWAATATLCLSTARRLGGTGDRRRRSFFLAGGALTLLWLLDDLLMIHEATDQGVVYAAYALATGVFLLRHGRAILAGEPVLLAISLGAFGLSVGIDGNLVPTPEAAHYFLEDGLKFTGICFWFAFFSRACRRAVFGIPHEHGIAGGEGVGPSPGTP